MRAAKPVIGKRVVPSCDNIEHVGEITGPGAHWLGQSVGATVQFFYRIKLVCPKLLHCCPTLVVLVGPKVGRKYAFPAVQKWILDMETNGKSPPEQDVPVES